MKKVLIAVGVLVALGVVAQRGENVGEPEKVTNPGKPIRSVGGTKSVVSADEVKSNNASPKASTAKPDVAAVPEKTGHAIGMERAEEVRNSHATPKTEDEAKGMVESINADTKTKLEDIDSKLDGAEVRLLNKKNKGEINESEYELKKAQLDALRARSEAISAKVN